MCSYAKHSEVGSARECKEVEDPHYNRDNRGNFAIRNTSKEKGCKWKKNVLEFYCNMEEVLKCLRTSHR
jgi:hypothetical protein